MGSWSQINKSLRGSPQACVSPDARKDLSANGCSNIKFHDKVAVGTVSVRTRMLPHFLIIGVQKSASTWLQEVLRRHSQIYLPRGETAFFENPDYAIKGLVWLEQSLCRAPANKLLGIKRPTDFTRPECAARIASDLPSAKLIVVLRNPVQRAISACSHMMRVGLWDVGSIEDRLRLLLNDPARPDPTRILANGCYGAALQQYLSYFPMQQLHLLQHSSIVEDTAAALSGVCDFLGVERDFVRSKTSRIINGGVYAPKAVWASNRLHRLRYRIDRENGRVYEKANILGAIGKVATFAFNNVLRCVNESADYPLVSIETRQRLLEYYYPDIEVLESLTGFDLNHWKLL